MGSSSNDAFAILFQLTFYVALICQIAIAAMAFVRFKFTAAGLLVGGGFGAGVLVQILFKIIQAVVKAAGSGNDAVTAVFAARGALLMLCSLVVAVGIVLIPSSLEKLRKPV